MKVLKFLFFDFSAAAFVSLESSKNISDYQNFLGIYRVFWKLFESMRIIFVFHKNATSKVPQSKIPNKTAQHVRCNCVVRSQLNFWQRTKQNNLFFSWHLKFKDILLRFGQITH